MNWSARFVEGGYRRKPKHEVRTTEERGIGFLVAEVKGCGDDENAAHARLISAAPDLLASCKEMLHHPHFNACECGKVDCATTRLRAAIAKAEGQL